MKSLSKLTFAAWTATSLLASTAFTQADLVPESFLPEKTLAVISVRNVERDWNQFQQTPFALMCQDPAMQPFMNHLNNAASVYWDQVKTILESQQIDLNEYTPFFNHFSGGATFALMSHFQDLSEIYNEKDIADTLFPCLILETTGDTAQIQNDFGKLKAKIMELAPDFHSETQVIGDVEYTVFSPDKGIEFWIGFKNNRCVICTMFPAPEELKQLTHEELTDVANKKTQERWLKNKERSQTILASIFSEEPSYPVLANTPEFKAHSSINAERNYLFLNFKPLKDFFNQAVQAMDIKYQKELPEDKMAAIMYPPKPSIIYDELGIEAFKSLSYTWSNENGEPNATLTLACPEAERKGLSALINSYVPGDCSPLPQVPDNTVSFSRCHIDPVQFWTTLDITTSRTIGGMKGVGVGFIQAFLMQDAAINLKKNVLENLTGDFITWKTSYEKQENGKLSNEGVVLVGAKDPEALLSTLGSVYDLIIQAIAKEKNIDTAIFTPQEKDFNGTKIYSIPLPLPENISENQASDSDDIYTAISTTFALPEFNFACVDGYVIFATRMPAIENFITNAQGNDFANKEGIPEAAEKIGGLQQCSFNYESMRFCYESVKYVLDIVVKKIENDLKANPSDETIDPRKMVVSAWNLLPKNGELQKYMSYSIITSKVTPGGIQWQGYMPMPKELEKKK